MAAERGHILIVEDELIVAHSIQIRLEQHGYVVDGLAKSGEEAFKLLETRTPDLILMDIRLSGPIDGIRAAERIRHDHPIPIIFLTAYSDDETLARAKITEPFGYIIKPFETRELVNNIEIALYRREMTAALEASEARFRGLFENAVIGLILLDHEGSIVEANPAMFELLGHDGESSPSPGVLQPHIHDLQLNSVDGSSWTAEITGSDGAPRLLKVTPTEIPKAPSSPPYKALFVEDITELERYERELRERQAALRALFVNEEAIRTEERTRLSRDIHDVLGQMLTAHKMDLHWIRPNSGDEKSEMIGEMIGHIDEMIVFVKRVCSELRDNVLDVFGFDVALDEHLKQFRERNGIEIELETEGTPFKLAPDREVSLLRIIQESLTNIVRHADATRIVVHCNYRTDGVTWTIEDNGVGFDRDTVAGKGSLGLVGMNERAVSWGGAVDIQSEPGEGTTVEVSMPREPDNV